MNDEQAIRMKCVELAIHQDAHAVLQLAAGIEKFVLGKAQEAATGRWTPPPPPAGYVAPGEVPLHDVTEEQFIAGDRAFERHTGRSTRYATLAAIYRAMDAAKPKG